MLLFKPVYPSVTHSLRGIFFGHNSTKRIYTENFITSKTFVIFFLCLSLLFLSCQFFTFMVSLILFNWIQLRRFEVKKNGIVALVFLCEAVSRRIDYLESRKYWFSGSRAGQAVVHYNYILTLCYLPSTCSLVY